MCEGFRDACGAARCGECRAEAGAAEWRECKCPSGIHEGGPVCTYCSDKGQDIAVAKGMPAGMMTLCLVCADMIVEDMVAGGCDHESEGVQCEYCVAQLCSECVGKQGSGAMSKIAGHMAHSCDGCAALVYQQCATGGNYDGGNGPSPSMWCAGCRELLCAECAYGDKDNGSRALTFCMACSSPDQPFCSSCVGAQVLYVCTAKQPQPWHETKRSLTVWLRSLI